LLFVRVDVQIEMQSNLLKTDGHIFGNAERAAKIEIAFRANRGVAQWNTKSGRDYAQCNARASDQRFEQHIGRTGALPIATGRRMKTGFDARFSGFDFARHVFADSSFGPQCDQRRLGTLAILCFQRRLQ
jgi:hypothetical protein